MQIIKYNHFSDTHVDQLAKLTDKEENWFPFFVSKSLQKIEQIIDNAIEEKKQLVVFAGDMFRDSYTEPKLKMEIQFELVRIFSKLKDTWIKLILDNWNHDNSINLKKKKAKKHLLYLYDLIKYDFVYVSDPSYQQVNYIKIDLNNGTKAMVAIVPYFDKNSKSKSELFKELKEKKEEFEKEVDVCFLVIHADIVWAQMNDKSKYIIPDTVLLGENPNIYKKRELDSLNYDIVCAWHYHLHQEICRNGYFSGSHMILGYGEEWEKKGFISGEYDIEEKKLEIKHEIIDDFLWKSIYIDCENINKEDINNEIVKGIDAVEAEYKTIENALIWIRLKNITNEQIEYINEKYVKDYLLSKKVLVIHDFEYKYLDSKGSNYLNNGTSKEEEDKFSKHISLNELDILNEFLDKNNIKDSSQKDLYENTLKELMSKL